MRKSEFLLLIFIVLASTSANSSEVDNFTLRGQLPNSREWLNQEMNLALDNAAAKTKKCDMFDLQKKIYRDLGGFFTAKIERWSKRNPYAAYLPIEHSIFAAIANERGDRGWLHPAPFKIYYGERHFAFNDLLIGDDKLGHFFQMGYSMYFAVRWKKDPRFPDIRTVFQRTAEKYVGDYAYIRYSKAKTPEELILGLSMFQENHEFGLVATMVRSYADIAANYAGYVFWRELTEGGNPYFRCTDKGWKRVRYFDWSEYVTPAWDEAINCSDYDPIIKSRVLNQIRKRGLKQCPMSADACAQVIKHYGPKVSSGLLHPKCFAAGSSDHGGR